MWPVDVGRTLCENHSTFVRAVDAFGAKRQLPARFDASRRSEDVVIAVAPIKFRTFDRWIVLVPVENYHAIIEQLRAVFAHATHNQDAFDSRAAPGERTHQIRFAIVIPKWTRIDPPFRRLSQHRFRPWADGIFRLYHVNPVVRIRKEDVEVCVVIANGRRPGTVSMLMLIEHIEGLLAQ